MKLSTKGRYGVRAMYDLALMYGQSPQSVKCIAERQAPPKPTSSSSSRRCARRGWCFPSAEHRADIRWADEPKNISVGAILRAVEGPLAATSCITEPCEHSDGCAMHALWERIHKGVNDLMDGISLQDMLDDVNRKCGENRCSCH